MSRLTNLTPAKIKKMNMKQLEKLAGEMRELIIQTVSENGGHLASNLGVVELAIALHRAFDSPRDKILWDVGHQCYAHKIITGRGGDFASLRKKDGLSGFPKPEESEHDAFTAGHSSSSISIAHGIATAQRLSGSENCTVCVVGDGAIAGGMAFEAINDCARCDERLIIVLNDNEMSIDRSVGALSRYLTGIRNGTAYFKFKDAVARTMERIPVVGGEIKKVSSDVKDRLRDMLLSDNFFQKMGLVYLGPADGHNIGRMTELFLRAKQLNRPVLIHVNTVKGKGYSFAENSPDTFHGLGQFNIATGTCERNSQDSYSVLMGTELASIAKKDKTVCAVSAAMVAATGLANMPKERLFDVGIAEEHAVSFSAGLAAAGMKPVCALYSTFLQRAYDQINQDVCLAGEHVVLCIDRAGIVGEDGETHQGLFDVGILTPLPNMVIYSPFDGEELKDCLRKAVYSHSGPVAVRYPRGAAVRREEDRRSAGDGYAFYRRGGSGKRLMVTYGRETGRCLKAAEILTGRGSGADVLSIIRIKPIPEETADIAARYGEVLFAEEGMERGGICEEFLAMLVKRGFKGNYMVAAVGDRFVKQATMCETLEQLGLDEMSLAGKFSEKTDET